VILIDEEAYDAEKHAAALLAMFAGEQRSISVSVVAGGESRSLSRRIDSSTPAAVRHREARGLLGEVCRRVVSAGSGVVSLRETGSEFRSIWPAMGFDASLPSQVSESLPESFDYARSVLELHATDEGQEWWRDHGCEVDYSLDLSCEPQVRVLKRFVENFVSPRADYAVGSGEGWLSPADMMRVADVWSAVANAGDLDEYEFERNRDGEA
jgi:hypothetical protein